MERLMIVPKTKDQAREWLRSCVEFFDLGFHPDTPGQDYVEAGSGKRTFTSNEAKSFEKARDAVFGLLDDPYAVGMEFFEPLIQKSQRR